MFFHIQQESGTKAAVMENQIDKNIKEERAKRLIELSNNNQKEYNKQYVGKEVCVLMEEGNKGHTANYLEVKVKSEEKLEGMKNVKILSADMELYGE